MTKPRVTPIYPSLILIIGIVIGLALNKIGVVNHFIGTFPEYLLIIPWITVSVSIVIGGKFIAFIIEKLRETYGKEKKEGELK